LFAPPVQLGLVLEMEKLKPMSAPYSLMRVAVLSRMERECTGPASELPEPIKQ